MRGLGIHFPPRTLFVIFVRFQFTFTSSTLSLYPKISLLQCTKLLQHFPHLTTFNSYINPHLTRTTHKCCSASLFRRLHSQRPQSVNNSPFSLSTATSNYIIDNMPAPSLTDSCIKACIKNVRSTYPASFPNPQLTSHRPHRCRFLRILEDPPRTPTHRITRTTPSDRAAQSPNPQRRCRALARLHCAGRPQLAYEELLAQEPAEMVRSILQVQERAGKRDRTG
jgi:hypothetical protein